jgi:hypothetical protein
MGGANASGGRMRHRLTVHVMLEPKKTDQKAVTILIAVNQGIW